MLQRICQDLGMSPHMIVACHIYLSGGLYLTFSSERELRQLAVILCSTTSNTDEREERTAPKSVHVMPPPFC